MVVRVEPEREADLFGFTNPANSISRCRWSRDRKRNRSENGCNSDKHNPEQWLSHGRNLSTYPGVLPAISCLPRQRRDFLHLLAAVDGLA